jgi:hypothetical protein
MATNPRDVRYWPKRTLERRGDDRQQLNGAASCNHETALHFAAAMALVVASTTAMAEPKKPSVSNKTTHRVKSAQPSNRVPTYEDRLKEYYELKRQGW